jgi:hypothetical protein
MGPHVPPRPRIALAIGVLGMVALAAGPAASGPTRLHDPLMDHDTQLHGVTNGQGAHRGPWVVQIAVAEGEFLYVRADPDIQGNDMMIRAIAGNGRVYFGRNHSLGSADLCIEVPVTGWVTVHIDAEGPSEQRFAFEFRRRGPCAFVDSPH